MTTLETRGFVEPIEFRSQGTKITASGVAMRYNAKSRVINGQFREQFLPGSFTKTIKEQDVRAHHEHGGPYLGRTTNGTLRLSDSRTELAYELDLPDTSAGRDAAALLERGDLRGSSIGFIPIIPKMKWSVDDDGLALRTVGEARLGRVDIVTEPAYLSSTVELAMRSLADDLHMEVRSLVDLDGRALSTLIASPPEGETPVEERGDDGRETPTVHRRPAAWFL